MNIKKRQLVKKRGDLQVEFYLQGEDEQLILQLKNWQTIQHFSLRIDQAYIENHTDLHSFFSSPSDLLYTLTELFDRLIIQPQGAIILSIKLDAIKINMTKQYAFQLKYEDKGQAQMYRTRIKQLQSQIGGKLEQKDEKISELIRKIQSLQKEVAELRTQQKSNSVELFNIKRDFKLKLQQIEEKDEEISSLKSQCQDQSEDVVQLRQQIMRQNEQIAELKTKLGLFNLSLSKKSNSVNEQNPHIYSFHYRYTSNSVQVKKKSDNGWANFISNFPIPNGQTTTFAMKMIKMRDGSLSIGIGSSNIFGNNVMDHNDIVAYFCRDGRIFENGQRKQGISHIAVKSSLNVEVDREKQKVSWVLEGTKVGQSSIPIHMQEKQLFLIVRMFWKQDEFELFF